MYIPEAFALIERADMLDVIAAHPFATLATNGADGPVVTQLPLVLETDADGRDWICGHFARANPHWKEADGMSAVTIFRGADGYITPSWYATKRETGKVVPTWNYVSVEARGPLRVAASGEETRRIVGLLTDTMEQRRAQPWAMADAPPSYTDAMLRGLVAFRVEVTAMVGAAKLSQNKSAADLCGVRDGLTAERPDSMLLGAMR